MAILSQDGCKHVKLNPCMGDGGKNEVSEHPRVFVGSANGKDLCVPWLGNSSCPK